MCPPRSDIHVWRDSQADNYGIDFMKYDVYGNILDGRVREISSCGLVWADD